MLHLNRLSLVVLVAYGLVLPVSAKVESLIGKPAFVPGEILVRLKSSASYGDRAQALSAMGTPRALDRPDLFKIKLSNGVDVKTAVEQIQHNAAVQYAQPNYRYYALACPAPTDQYYTSPENWPLTIISAPQAWNLFSACSSPGPGSSSVTVAVLDSGISRLHPDLQGVPLIGYNAICAVTEEDPSCSCTYPVTDSASVTATLDDFGHGTYVSGIIGASWNLSYVEKNSSYYPDCNDEGAPMSYSGKSDNGGFAGLAPGVVILPVKVLDCTGGGTSDSIVGGIDYAITNGARVLNLSLGGDASDPAEQEAVNDALNAGCVVVASAGNESNLPAYLAPLDYPAGYPGVISVGASDEDDNVAVYSNGGAGLDLVAPGGSGTDFNSDAISDSKNKVFSTFLSPLPVGSVGTSLSCGFEPLISPSGNGTDPNFGVAAGTSAAAPYVSATAALILSMYPNLTNTQVAQAIINNTDSLNGNTGWDGKTGYGRLNVYKALLNAGTGTGQVTNYLNTFNSPNPFYTGTVSTTNITIAITQPAPVELTIFDTSGEVVFHKNFSSSELTDNPSNPQYKSFFVPWNGENGNSQPVKTGIYFYSVKVNGQVGYNKIALIQGTK